MRLLSATLILKMKFQISLGSYLHLNRSQNLKMKNCPKEASNLTKNEGSKEKKIRKSRKIILAQNFKDTLVNLLRVISIYVDSKVRLKNFYFEIKTRKLKMQRDAEKLLFAQINRVVFVPLIVVMV